MGSIEADVLIMLIVLNALSIALCFFAILIYILAKPLRIYAFKLVFWMNIADLFRSISQIVPQVFQVTNKICDILGAVHVFSSCFTLFWAFVIAVTIYQVLVRKITDVEKYYNLWLGIGLSISAISGMVPIFFNDFSNLQQNCTLSNNFEGLILKFAIFYIPAFIITIVNLVIFLQVYYVFKKEQEFLTKNESMNVKRLFYYPIVLILTIIPAMVDRGLGFFNVESEILLIVSDLTWTAQGLLNPFCYTLTKPVKDYILSFCMNKNDRRFTFNESERNKASIFLSD